MVQTVFLAYTGYLRRVSHSIESKELLLKQVRYRNIKQGAAQTELRAAEQIHPKKPSAVGERTGLSSSSSVEWAEAASTDNLRARSTSSGGGAMGKFEEG